MKEKSGRPYPFLIESRDHFGKLLNAMKLTGNAVEIGVSFGNFSKHLLKTSDIQKLYSIDHWLREERYQKQKKNSKCLKTELN